MITPRRCLTTPIIMSLKYEVCVCVCVCVCAGRINFWRQSKVAADKRRRPLNLQRERGGFLLMRVFSFWCNQAVSRSALMINEIKWIINFYLFLFFLWSSAAYVHLAQLFSVIPRRSDSSDRRQIRCKGVSVI